MPNIIKQRYLKIDLDICVLNYKLAKQSKANLDQTTNANLDTNKPKEQKQFFKILNNSNSIKALFVNFNPNQTTATFEITTA